MNAEDRQCRNLSIEETPRYGTQIAYFALSGGFFCCQRSPHAQCSRSQPRRFHREGALRGWWSALTVARLDGCLPEGAEPVSVPVWRRFFGVPPGLGRHRGGTHSRVCPRERRRKKRSGGGSPCPWARWVPREATRAGQRMGKRTAGTAFGATPAVVSFPGPSAGRRGLEQAGRIRQALGRWTTTETGNSSAPDRLGVWGVGVAAQGRMRGTPRCDPDRDRPHHTATADRPAFNESPSWLRRSLSL